MTGGEGQKLPSGREFKVDDVGPEARFRHRVFRQPAEGERVPEIERVVRVTAERNPVSAQPKTLGAVGTP